MAKQTIGIGTAANDGTGDTLRGAMIKVNENFDEVYGGIESLTTLTIDMANYVGKNFLITMSANLSFTITNVPENKNITFWLLASGAARTALIPDNATNICALSRSIEVAQSTYCEVHLMRVGSIHSWQYVNNFVVGA